MTASPTKEQNNGIPADVWEAAARVKHDILFCEESEVVGVIAKAILTERERCAAIAEDYAGVNADLYGDFSVTPEAGARIAAAIRGEG